MKRRILAPLTALVMTAAPMMQGLCLNAAAAGIESYEDSEELILDCGGRAGYDYLGTMENGEAMQMLYDEMYETAVALWYDTQTELGTVEGYGMIDKVPMNGLSFNDASKVYFTFKSDNPIFYFCSYLSAAAGDSFVMLCDRDYCDPEIREQAQQKIEEYIGSSSLAAENSETLADKIRAVHDKLCDDMEYARDYSGRPSEEYWAHDITGAAMYGQGVCEAYSRTFQLVLNYMDVDNRFITGRASGDNHSWNMVRMEDGLNYFVDPTWDDLNGSDIYFLKGSETMDIDHITDIPGDDPSHFLPELTDVSTEDYSADTPKKPDDETTDNEVKDTEPKDTDTTDGETTDADTTDSPMTGDADGDGNINVRDIAMVAAHIKGTKALDEKGSAAADANKDGKLDVTDIAMIAGHIKGIKALV